MSMTDTQKAQTKDKIVEWISYILRRKHWTGTDLARKADLAPSTILRLLNSKNHTFLSTFTTMGKISRASGYDIPAAVLLAFNVPVAGGEAQGDAVMADAEMSEMSEQGDRAHRDARAIQPPYGSRRSTKSKSDTLPMVYVSTLPKSLQVKFSANDVVRPEFLEHDTTAFAFHVPDDALQPYYQAKALAYASKARDPRIGDIVLVTKSDGTSMMRAVTNVDENGLTLFRPTGDASTISFDGIDDVSIVVGTMRGL